MTFGPAPSPAVVLSLDCATCPQQSRRQERGEPAMSTALRYDVLFLDDSYSGSSQLPSPNDIDASQELSGESDASRIARIGEFVVKYGFFVESIEAYNMLHVARCTSVPVPKVYAIYRRAEEHGVLTYIVMDFVPGSSLQNLWASLDRDRKVAIAKTLRLHFDELRKLQHPGYFGNLHRGPPLDELFLGTQGAQEAKSSFATEDELINCIIRIYGLETGERMAERTHYYQHVLPHHLRGNGSPVFTHNDFQRKNIIIKPDEALVIIDWEFASWHPTYWEYASAIFANGGWNDDWHQYVGMVLDEYPNQALWLATMKREMWF